MAAYGTDNDFLSYLAGQGLTLPAGSPSPEVLRNIGSAYVDAAYEPSLFCSERSDPWNQELAWPRYGAKFGERPVPSDLVPRPWVVASYRAAYLHAASSGWALAGRDPSRLVKREKVDGAAEREFFEIGKGATPGKAAPGFNVDPIIEGLVGAWLCAPPEEVPGFFFMSIGDAGQRKPGRGHNGGPALPEVPPPGDRPDPEPPGPVDPPTSTTPTAEFGERHIRVLDFGDEILSPDSDFGEGQITVTST